MPAWRRARRTMAPLPAMSDFATERRRVSSVSPAAFEMSRSSPRAPGSIAPRDENCATTNVSPGSSLRRSCFLHFARRVAFSAAGPAEHTFTSTRTRCSGSSTKRSARSPSPLFAARGGSTETVRKCSRQKRAITSRTRLWRKAGPTPLAFAQPRACSSRACPSGRMAPQEQRTAVRFAVGGARPIRSWRAVAKSASPTLCSSMGGPSHRLAPLRLFSVTSASLPSSAASVALRAATRVSWSSPPAFEASATDAS